MENLSKFGLEPDLKKKTVTIGNEEVVVCSGKDCTAKVPLVSDTTISASFHLMSQARTEGDAAEGRNVLLEPEVHEEELGLGILVATSLFSPTRNFLCS